MIFGNNVENIGYGAFEGCTKLQNITLPDSLKTIGGRAFMRCESIDSMIIPDSVTVIGDNAFKLCINLTNIKLPDGIEDISIVSLTSADVVRHELVQRIVNAYALHEKQKEVKADGAEKTEYSK